MYDIEQYENELRGFYIDLAELPGAIIQTENELIDEIRKTKTFEYTEKYKAFNQKFNPLDDANASKRVVEKII
jgi:CDP-glycerol glycerophosphotransferase